MAIQQATIITTTSVAESRSSSHDEGSSSEGRNKEAEPNRVALAQSMSPEELAALSKKVKWKADKRLIGMAWIMYVLNYFDRNEIGAARVIGMQQSLNMTTTQFGVAIAIFFVGYMSMQVPSNFLLARLRPSIYLPACMIVWGALSVVTAFLHSKAELYVLRFFLGFLEAPFTVGLMFVVSSWYTRSELGLRSALLMSAPMVGSAFSGLLTAAIYRGMEGVAGIQAWRWMFILGGASTILVAVVAFWVLPDFPSNTRWLSPEERAVAEWRLILDAGQVDEDGDPSWSHGVKSTVWDWRVHVFALMGLLVSLAASTNGFFPSVVKTLGFRRTNTLLLTAGPYLVAVFAAILNSWCSDRFRNCSYFIIWPLVAAIIGCIIIATSSDVGARYFAMFLMIAAGHSANAVVIAWVQKTFIRPRTKRAVTIAFVNCIGGFSHIISSFLYRDRWAPRYAIAMTVNASSALGTILLAVVMRMVLRRANRKLNEGTEVASVMHGESTAEIAGLTEQERRTAKEGFRYVT
ncbi:hypothetical protein LTR20_006130 [Exophiala xenobiotica]|nr:hypothetical protein LTR92_006518 [Exophiala xenobiotica]KAK5382237.1 hypothetical protein LTS13_002901 [Exophiala xenobiotica]KAK5395896.1 hypothetical protein LTR79_006650 [Exophiala xenobiotica]KAK5423850.1 hypothetical protein LTR90_001196 [Exophiala xenobiotica]KAK5462181.1 hypothetical protein LTR20_006130 [Exophiala xenobiotica]